MLAHNLLSLSLVALATAAPFEMVKRDGDEGQSCPLIPVIYDHSNVTARSLPMFNHVQMARGLEVEPLEKRADGAGLLKKLADAIDDETDDKPCFDFEVNEWTDTRALPGRPPGRLAPKSLRTIFNNLNIPGGEVSWAPSNPDAQSSKVYHSTILRYWEGGYDKNDEDQQPSAGFTSLVSTKHGVFIAQDNNRGTSKASWNQAAWYQWQKTSGLDGGSVDNLKYIVRYNVVNTIAQPIIVEALDGEDEKEFSREENSDMFYKLLGSPNGSGSAWLLIDYHNAVGDKTVEKITCYKNLDDGEQYHMILTLNSSDDVEDADED